MGNPRDVSNHVVATYVSMLRRSLKKVIPATNDEELYVLLSKFGRNRD